VSNPAQNGRGLVWHCGDGAFRAVEFLVSSIVFWVRRLGGFARDSLRKLFATETYPGQFPSQRMCPFCGLITARSKAFCLECGKSLQEVHP
jgi:hypothetical protein